MVSDVRRSVRGLARSPGFTAVAVLTLALAIGGTTAMFSSVNGVLLRPLPYPEPAELLGVCETSPEMPAEYCGASPANSADWARRSESIESFGLARTWFFQIVVDGERSGLTGGVATPGVFDVFQVRPHLGRLFTPEDLKAGGEKAALLSHGLWLNRFGGDPEVVGRQMQVDEEVRTIIGVLPVSFELPYLDQVELWIPLWPERVDWRGWRGFWSFGRLRDGFTLGQARAEMATIREQLAEEFPETNEAMDVGVFSLHDRIVGSVRPALLMFLGAVGFVLLIACANIANLLLARSATRDRELAVRVALGAGRRPLARLLLTESLVLGLAGGALGTLLAFWLVELFSRLAPTNIPRLDAIAVDGWVLAFAFLLSGAVSVLFGIAPVWGATRVDVEASLREGSRGSTVGLRNRLRSVLATAEIALALVLLTGAGLLARSFVNLLGWEPGFDQENLIMVQIFAPSEMQADGRQMTELYRRATEGLAALPGVVSAGAGSAVPLMGGDGSQEFYVEGLPVPEAGERPVAWWYDVGPNYFRTLRVPVLRGRAFEESDTASANPVIVINETLAEKIFPGEDPVGKRLHLVVHEMTAEIVGVVGDVQPFRPGDQPNPEVYWPYMQVPRGAIILVMRTAGPTVGIAESIKARLLEVEQDLSVGRLATMEQRIDGELVRPRFQMSLLGLFSGVALVIATVGVYGVIAYLVAQRRREMGIRMALGAERRDILRLVIRRAALMALPGIALGLGGAWALTRLLQSFLVDVSASDPATFAATALVLAVAVALAGFLPAQRASRVDPLVALRYE